MKEVAVKQFTGGMNQDVNPKFSAEGSYRFALNATMEAEEGYMVSLSNELGNHSLFTLSNNLIPIGSCNTDTEKLILFSTNDSISEIGEFDPDTGIYTTLIRSSCLNFNTKYPISCLFNLRRGCERVIYFTDRFNKYRSINLSSLTNYTDEPTALEANAGDTWNCDSFNLSPNYLVPQIDLVSVNDFGGSLKVGAYQFAIQYIDQDGNSSNWFYVSNPVMIVDEPLTAAYEAVNGGLPIVTTGEAEEGSVATTNKSITLQISDLDENYPAFRIAALHSTGNIGKVTETWITDTQFITGDTQLYTYGGPNLNTDTLGSLQDIIIDDVPIHVAKAHAIVDQALWLGNLENVKYDYAEFQAAASRIISAPKIKTVPAKDILSAGDPKNPGTSWNARGFMPDEVYAFAIQYLFKDGSWSPAFHIPGRKATTFDLELVADTINNSHLGTGSFPRWRVKNTNGGYGTNFAYHETLDTNYPDISTCDGTSIWGVDSTGSALQGNRIRHHRFPDRRSVPIYNAANDTIRILGVQFTNVDYPHTDIVGHRFLYAQRTEDNKTVLDNGILSGITTTKRQNSSTYYGNNFLNTNSHKVTVFISPKTLIERRYLSINHFRAHTSVKPVKTVSEGAVDDPAYNSTMSVYQFDTQDITYEVPFNENMHVQYSLYVDPRASQQPLGSFTFPLVNESFSNPAYFFSHVNDILSEYANDRYIVASAKRSTDPYKSLSSLIYNQIHTGYLTEDETPELYGGDSYVTNFNYFNLHDVNIQGDSGGLFGNIEDGQIQYAKATYAPTLWIDSEVNFSLRHGGTQRCNAILTTQEPWKYLRDKLYDPDPDAINPFTLQPKVKTKYQQRSSFCPEYYGYNKDYSKVPEERVGIALSYTFNYCSECLNSFPYRIRVSQKSYLESSLNNFKVFRDGDRTDLLGTTGPITSLKVKDDNLYALTKRGVFFIPINAQTLQTSENLLYLGTGDRLSVPPRRLSSAEYSDGGCSHFLASIVTEYGLFYVDYLSNKVILLGGQGAQDITNEGMKKFFQNNMEFELDKQFRQVFQMSYPYLDNTTYKYGLGYSIAYDPKFRRIIISKKDYRLREEFVSQLKETERVRGIYWDGHKFIDNRRTQEKDISFTEEEFFENRSWTISFYIPYNKWSSFHSYLPDLMFNDSRCFFTSNGTSNVWKHNDGNYQTFYNNKSDYVIDFTTTSNPSIASVYSVVDVNCNIETESDTDNIFFNYATIYNSYQCSGKLPVEIRTNSFAPALSNTLYATRAERSWRLSDFRDYVTDYTASIFSKDWDDLFSNYFIDKVVNPDAVDINKSQFELGRFRDTYLGCRLYFNPAENARITTDIIASINKLSYR